MDPFALTRSLIDIESITGREKAAGEFLFATLSKLAAPTAGAVEQMEVSPDRFNVLATWGTPVVTLSTHMDTVPPFFPSSEDDEFIRGRGACDVAAAGKAREAANDAARILAPVWRVKTGKRRHDINIAVVGDAARQRLDLG